MVRKAVSGMTMTLLLIGMLTLASNVKQVEAEDNLILEMSVNKTVVVIGETINITLTLKNTGNTTITLPFSSSQVFDIYLCIHGLPILAWSHDKAFLTIVWELTLNPGDEFNQTLQWNFHRYDRQSGNYVPPEPGHYELKGVCVASRTWSDLLPIWLVPAGIVVPYDYPTIQAAINSASNGDSIYVKAGTYYEHVVVNKTVWLFGESQSTTIINGNMTFRGVEVTASNVTLSGFTVQDSSIGIFLAESSSSIISDNSISNLGYGVMLHKSTLNRIYLNTICNNTIGLVISTGSSYNTIERNIVGNNTNSGIDIEQSSYNAILSNEISGNDRGIILVGSTTTGNRIVGNSISNNGGATVPDGGVCLIDWPHDNMIYHNNFLYNTHQASVSGSSANTWDNGLEGNFWSDYPGIDSSTPPDGIGDTPHVIDANNQDNYPLMNRYWNPTDINYDLKVDIKDLAVPAKAFGSFPSHSLWNPRADLTGPDYLVSDSKVDIRDIALIAKNYGKTYP